MAQEEEVGKEGKKRESEKKESRGSSDALRLPRPKRETAIWHFGRNGMDWIGLRRINQASGGVTANQAEVLARVERQTDKY